MASIDAEQFSLRWNNFHNNLTAGFHDLLLGEDLVDVTIAAEGKFVQAHKMVLSVCSPYFKDLFKVNPCKHPIVILKDTGYKELEALLQFMYRGEVNVRQEELGMFLKTAEMLQIKGLTGSDSPKDPSESSQTTKSATQKVTPARTHQLPQDTSTHPPPKRKRSEAPSLPSTSTPNASQKVVDAPPQTPPEGSGSDQATQDGNDFIQMMNPKMEPQEYDESEDGLDFSADDSVGQDPLVQQLLSGGDAHSKGNLSGLGGFVGLPALKEGGNIGQDGSQGVAYWVRGPRSNYQLLHQGYLYVKNKTVGAKEMWRCVERGGGCNGRVHTVGSKVVKQAVHSHEPRYISTGIPEGFTKLSKPKKVPEKKPAVDTKLQGKRKKRMN